MWRTFLIPGVGDFFIILGVGDLFIIPLQGSPGAQWVGRVGKVRGKSSGSWSLAVEPGTAPQIDLGGFVDTSSRIGLGWDPQ